MGASPGDPVEVRLAHASDGRVRLRLARRLDRDALSALADHLTSASDVRRVRVRPNTDSVIVEGIGPGTEILRRLERQGVVAVLAPEPPPQFGPLARLGIMRIDMELKDRTEGVLDFRSSLALVLLGGAVIQLVRGQVAGPATTLVVSALSLLEQSRK